MNRPEISRAKSGGLYRSMIVRDGDHTTLTRDQTNISGGMPEACFTTDTGMRNSQLDLRDANHGTITMLGQDLME